MKKGTAIAGILLASIFLLTAIFLFFKSYQVGTFEDFKKSLKESASYSFKFGDKIDSLNGVYVYYNGNVNYKAEKHLTKDGYYLGAKYQCVEFAKRYYYEHLNHKMPNPYGYAKDFFDASLKDGTYNTKRDLIQFSNPSDFRPEVNDLIIFDEFSIHSHGHIAIISKVNEHNIEIIQQNMGKTTRAVYQVEKENGKWLIKKREILGRLRKK